MATKLIYSKSLGPCKAARRQLSPAGPNWSRVGFILAVTVFLCSSYILAADPLPIEPGGGLNVRRANPGLPRYRVFSLRHIPAERGKKYLAEAKIGTVSQLPGPNALLVTAQRGELIKASAILKLVDAKEPFVIKALFPASSVKNLPSNEQIAAEVGNISIGTFSEPPALAANSKAIIDIHNDAVIAVAPAGQLEKIITAIEQLQKGKSKVLQPAKKPVEPNQISELKAEPALLDSLRSMAGSEAALNRIAAPASAGVVGQGEAGDSESDELFDKLLGSLAEAEKRKAESRQVETEPNEPGTVVIVPGPNEPGKPSVGPAQPREADPLAVILERLNALESAVKGSGKTPVQREPERTEEDVVAKIEKPGEVVGPGPISNGDETLELDLPEKINIIQLLDLVSKFLGYDYMYDPVDVAGLKGEVTITMRKIKVKHLYPLLESVLKFKDFVMTRKDNLLVVVPVAKAIDIDPPLRSEQAKDVIGDVIITRVFELKDIDTASAQTLLTGMKLGVSVTPIPEAKQLIVTEYTSRMARIKELLEMIDKPGEPKKFRSRQLEYTMANVLAPKIKELAEQLGTVSVTIGAPSAVEPRPSVPRPGESSAAKRAREARAAAARAAAARARTTTAATPAAAQPTVYLDADERTNRILMIGLAEQLDVVDELIDTLDVEKQDLRTLRLYEIQHVDAEEVMRKLEELDIISGGQAAARGPARTTSGTTPTTRVSGPTTPVTTRTGITTTTGETLVEEPQVVIIESTNSLLVNATAEQHDQIVTIIGYVDSEVEQGVIPYVIYPLENQDPEELGITLNKLVTETTTKQDKDAKIVTTTKKLEEDIYIIPDPKTYSLIVYASKKNQQWISSLIEQLDEYRPQVLIDVTLVEITKNEEFTLALDLVSKFPKLAAGASMDYLTAMIDPFPLKRIAEAMSTSGAGGGFYADEHIQVLLDAMHQKGYGRILARPKLLVNDNQEGSIKTEEQTSVAQEKTQTLPAAVGGGGTVVTTVAFESYTAGITLNIKPHISKGDQLQLDIKLTRADFRLRLPTSLKGAEYPTPPDLLTSDVETKVTVPDGTTIILGGLERLKQTKGGTKVPILGDLPGIGGLFRSTANTDDQSRLYVFVKAHILRPGEDVAAVSDIEVVSAKNRATFEKYEKEMQEYEDWPGIKPKPMDPVQILEADEEK